VSRRLWTFHGGLELDDHKARSTSRPLGSVALPAELVLPLQQHIGESAVALVEVGEQVLKGQKIAELGGQVSVPLHAPTSGRVVAIEPRAVPHPSGMNAPAIVIESDGKEQWFEPRERHTDYTTLDAKALRYLIREAGIVGLGGAGFPAFLKLNPGARTAVETLLLNGAECEPYISCDDMLMRNRPEAVLEGAHIMQQALNAKTVLVAIEENKPDAFAALRAALADSGRSDIELVMVPARYPTGGERQLIKVVTGHEVPHGGLPLDIGIVCHNVATAASVFDAVVEGKPLISRIVTITGEGVKEPQNLQALIGTPISALVEACGGYTDRAQRLVMGGPMMGVALQSDEIPVVKTANCYLIEQNPQSQPAMPCIRCGECAEVCPAQLLPQQLYWHARAADFDKIQDYNLFDCIECGCCAQVCPSHIPLVHYYRHAKTEIWAQERERKHSDIARQRHEARLARLERDKAERAEKLRKKREALKQKESGDKPDGKKTEIQAALERVRAKQAEKEGAPKNTDNLTPEQQRAINEADARRKQSQQATTDSNGEER